MLDKPGLNHFQRLQVLSEKFDDLIASRKYVPFTYPMATYGSCIVFTYLMVPHLNRPFLRWLRWPVWMANTVMAIYLMTYTRAMGMSTSYSVGLGMMWSIEFYTAILLVYDAQTDFCRIERPQGSTGRMPWNPTPPAQVNNHDSRKAIASSPPDKSVSARHVETHVWQTYPLNSLAERVDWILDLVTEFRGMTWNWRIPNLPRPPMKIMQRLRPIRLSMKFEPFQQTSVPFDSYPDEKMLLRHALKKLVIGYLLVDMIKTLAMHDPWYVGYPDQPLPPIYPLFIRASPVLTRCCRLTLGLVAIYLVLWTIFTSAPLFFVGLLGSKRIGVRGEAWVYPDEWGSYRSVLDRGLAGWWGLWWHQSFRFAFEAPSRRLVAWLGLPVRSTRSKAIQLFVGFALSGALHASGSYTSLGDTRPLRGPFLFFILQPFGILTQMAATTLLKRIGIWQRTPKLIKQLTNFVYVHFWMYHTASLFVEDLAKGGQFLFEPCPLSLMRWLNLGPAGGSAWTWGGNWFPWHSGRYWWQSGFVL